MTITTYPEVERAFMKLGHEIYGYLVAADSLDHHQFVIDLIEELQDDMIGAMEEHQDDPRQRFFDLNRTMGSTCYRLDVLLEVMDKSLPAYVAVKGILEEYRRYDDIKYVGLL